MHKPKGSVMMVIIGGGGASGSAPSPMHGRLKKKKGCSMISIPLSALGASDETGEAVTPAVGESISLANVEGTVKSIKGDVAHVEINTVNGEPAEYVNMAAKSDGVGEDNAERDAMLDMAMESDEEDGYEV